jgi:hypothetical protein
MCHMSKMYQELEEIKCFDCDTTNSHHVNLTRDTQQDKSEPTRNCKQYNLMHCALVSFSELEGH